MPNKQNLRLYHFTPSLVAIVFLLICNSLNGYAALDITPRLSSGVEYTDNYFLTNDNIGSEKESEWTYSVSPGISIDITGRGLGLSLSYDPSYTMYENYSENNYWEQNASAAGTWQATRHTNMSLSYDFSRTEDPIDEEDLTIRRNRNLYDRHTAEARIEYSFGSENSIFTFGNYECLENEDVTIEDNDEYGGGVGLAYWFNINWGVELSFEQSMADYEESNDFTDRVGQIRINHQFNRQVTGYLQYEHTDHRYKEDISDTDYKIHDGALGIEYAIDSSMDLSLEVHYVIRNTDEGDNEASWPVDFSFTKRFTQGAITLSTEGGYDYTTATAENLGYYIYYGGSLDADYNFTRYITGDLGISYTYNEYRDQAPMRNDDVYRANCGLSFQLLRWITLRLDYSFSAVESNIEDNDYVENSGSIFITITPSQPYRF